MAELQLREAIVRGLREAMDADERVILLGEDIGEYGGAYAVTKGLMAAYGQERVRDTPISEAVIVGASVGAAMGGIRPIVEVMTINFTLLAMDQIVNHAAKLRYMSNGQISIPMVLRTVTGGGGQLGATHSQSFEGWYANVPGLIVATPATSYDALGLLRSAVLAEDAVIFAEHQLLYGFRGEVPDEPYTVPFGKAATRRQGSDVTLVGYSRMANVAVEAARILAERGVDSEVIDLRTLRPLDTDTVLESVRKTGRAVVVEENWRTGGFAAELAATIQESAFDELDGPVGRVGAEEVPFPYNGRQEAAAIPDAERVASAVACLFGV
ncbi:MAG: alpha-ketoacid dehydrogenase subunit beta [Dehalococcoidia bacterium]|nr:alpha-ketoacid dehydrogenase subunit beta [Dehalococcoidia bacterium]